MHLPFVQSLIDVTRGIGAELLSSTQKASAHRPLIALGSVGQLEGATWQVVGFQHREGQEPGDDETFGWNEYLLFNRQRGFVFLVDASDGWSLVRPATGAPKVSNHGQTAHYLGVRYQRSSVYSARTTYVLGEFYWQVHSDQRTENTDYAGSGNSLLSMEKSAHELTWSYGSRIGSQAVAQAFGLKDKSAQFRRDEVAPFVAAKGTGCATIFVVLVFLFIVVVVLAIDTGTNTSSYTRSSGGSWGGYSSGGSHK